MRKLLNRSKFCRSATDGCLLGNSKFALQMFMKKSLLNPLCKSDIFSITSVKSVRRNKMKVGILILVLLLQMTFLMPAFAETSYIEADKAAEVPENAAVKEFKTDSENSFSDRAKNDRGWKIKPGLAFHWKRRGIDWSVGPRLGVSKKVSESGRISLNFSFLPLRYSELKSGSRVDYARFDLGYRHFLNRKLYVGAGFGVHRFSPSEDFSGEVALRNGKSEADTINTASISVGHQVFKIAWSFRGRKVIWPFFLEASWQEAESYQYGADLGDAGTEFRVKSGFSLKLRPLSRKF